MSSNRGKRKHYISIWERKKTTTTNRLGETTEESALVKNLFAEIETRVGGLLSGRPANTVMTTVTHKFTWDFRSFPEILPDKHYIKYRGKEFEVNYSLNEGFKDEELQVFVTEKV